jgi:hypothetical protein
MELREISSEEQKTIEMMERRVNALQEKRNEDLRLMDEGMSTNEIKFAALRKENAQISSEMKEMEDECRSLRQKLATTEELMKRAKKNEEQRMRFLEKENLDLILHAKKLEKTAKTNASNTSTKTMTSKKIASKTRSNRKSTRKKAKEVAADKENSIIVAVSPKANKKKRAAEDEDAEDTMLLNELMADAGITEVEMEGGDDEEPECHTQ